MKRFKNRREKPQVNSQINVTSLVDVMLVLLIIFILIAPLIEHGIKISLPKASPSELDRPDMVIKVTREQIYLNDDPVDLTRLGNTLSLVKKSSPDSFISVQADHGIQYKRVIEVLDLIRLSGITNVALATDTKATR